MFGLIVDQRRILLEDLVVSRAAGELQFVDRLRIEQVVFAILTPLVLAAGIERVIIDDPLREGMPVPHFHFAGQHIHSHALDARGCPSEILVDNRMMKANCLEDLRAAITLDGRNAHLRDHFDHSLDGCLDEILAGFFVFDVPEQALTDHVVQRLEGQIGVNRPGPITDQQREMMDFARLARFQHQANPGASAFANQVVVNSRHGQQGWDGGIFRINPAIGQNDDVDSSGNRAACLRAQLVHRFFQAGRPLIDFVKNRERD